MKKKLISLLLLLLSITGFAHGDEPHTAPAATAHGATYFTSEAISDKYELLLKYEFLEPGAESTMRLFVSEYKTNKAVGAAQLKVTVNDHPEIEVHVSAADSGEYVLEAVFPKKQIYNLSISLNAKSGADLLLLKNVETGKHPDEEKKEEKSFILDYPFLTIIGAFVAGLLVMLLIRRPFRKKINTIILAFALFVSNWFLFPQNAAAHDGHDESGASGNSFSTGLVVPKETQFLFNVLTKEVQRGEFTGSTKLFGTVIPSSNGQAILSIPQNGRITALNISVGSKVKKGQQLAIAELQMDAGGMVNFLAEKNNMEAEYQAAKSNYDRLISIKDIAAQKDISEAQARLKKAEENRKLFNSGSGRTYIFTSPIDGVVGNFSTVIGSSVLANETVFTVIDLSKVYVEAQVFDKDVDALKTAGYFTVQCTNDDHKTAQVRLLSYAQSINPTNQSQRVLFEMDNPDGDFKIGEFVNVRIAGSEQNREIALPNSAITEINGKPAVFIKESAEHYSLSYVSLGENNGEYTVINKGVEEIERVVTNATYQLKMIYLNQ
ncbi:MAG: efflux RND transporter periplasmic adaptor subunit [Bacteroidota bacterium]|nr:efflux RND transporter periplasmic adaptor subunit [Bacteroidota bacterium]